MYKSNAGYLVETSNGAKNQVHVLVAEKTLGKCLPKGAIVHHADGDKLNNDPSNLVICPDRAYHNMLHRRQRAYEACGHADWLKCNLCGHYDEPENLYVNVRSYSARHRECHARYMSEKRTGGNYAKV